MRGLALALLSTAAVLAAEDPTYDSDPKLNLRPVNVTDLNYFLYGWVGSYYNGTTTFTLSPLDYGSRDNEKVCSTFKNQIIEKSYDSLVAITKANEYDRGHNNIMFLVKAWQPGFNLTPPAGNMNPLSITTDDLPFALESTEASFEAHDTTDQSLNWNITASYLAPTSYSFRGSSDDPRQYIQFNMSDCNTASDTLFAGSILDPGLGILYDQLNITAPTIQGQFDNSSATFEINGYFEISAKNTSLVGLITISFLGNLDTVRSDILVLGQNEPQWDATVGFSKKSIYGGDTSRAERQTTSHKLAYGFGLLFVASFFFG